MAKPNKLSLVVVWILAVIAILPVILKWSAPAPSRTISMAAVVLATLAGALICFLIFRTESRRLARSQAITLAVLIVLEACVCTFVHHFLVDKASWGIPTTEAWQLRMQNDVMHLSPKELPHSYRFLPNSIVFWLQMMRIRFDVASQIFRVLSAMLLFYTLYVFARRYTTYRGAVVALFLAGLVYPSSFVAYFGQLTDPLSHLSFLLAFIFLETEDYPFFLTTLLIGSLAKETVLALSGFYVLFCRKERNYLAKASALCAATVASYFAVRTYVLHGSMQYKQVSNVTLSQVSANIHSDGYVMHILITVGVLVPFVWLTWKDTPVFLKRMLLYLTAVLFLSSLLFSWLNETRNYMPLVFVMAIIAGRWFDKQFADSLTQDGTETQGEEPSLRQTPLSAPALSARAGD